MERFWVPLCILTVAGFTFNTSELIPIGLLSDIAGSFGVSEARAGMLITVYAKESNQCYLERKRELYYLAPLLHVNNQDKETDDL